VLIVRLALRNALRNRRRSMLTAGTVLLGTALLTVATAFIGGIFNGMFEDSTASVGHVRVVNPEFAEREQLMPLYANLPDVDALVAEVLQVPGVVDAYPVIRVGAALTGNDEMGEALGLVHGAPTAFFRDRMDLEEKLVEGSWFSADAKAEAVLGVRLAQKAEAGVGDEVLIVGQTQDGSISPIKLTVVGIVSAGGAMVDQAAFVPLERLQWLTDIEDGAIEVLVFGDDLYEAAELAAGVRRGPLAGAQLVEPWTERDPFAGMMGIGNVVKNSLGFLLVFVTALGVWNTMMMSVLERTSEIGVLRSMGLSRLGAVSLFVIEALVISAIGGLLGVGLGSIPAYYLEVYGVTFGELAQNMGSDVAISATMRADLTFTVVLRSFALGLIMAVVGSAIPSIRAASIQPVSAMRSGR
jgi:putative ABC transport system permease protein